MRANEFITEAIAGTSNIGPITVHIDDHSIDRARTRGVYHKGVDYVIRRLPKIINKLEQVESGTMFWVYDWSAEISLGMRRVSSTKLEFILKTVLPKKADLTPDVQKIISI